MADTWCEGLRCAGCPFEHDDELLCAPEIRALALHWYIEGLRDMAHELKERHENV